MIIVKIDYIIKQNEKLEIVYHLINDFIEHIRQNEPHTLEYRSFQHLENDRHFYHLMRFTDEKAQSYHRTSNYCAEFVEKLYPLCEKSPKASPLIEINKK